MTESDGKLHFLLDAGLPAGIAVGLRRLGVEIDAVEGPKPDEDVIGMIAEYRHRGVWITQDVDARHEHRDSILSTGVSVAWIRTHNVKSLTKLFLVMAIVHGRRDVLLDANEPRYLDVWEHESRGVRTAWVRMSTEL